MLSMMRGTEQREVAVLTESGDAVETKKSPFRPVGPLARAEEEEEGISSTFPASIGYYTITMTTWASHQFRLEDPGQ
jgi:hypothetical protein